MASKRLAGQRGLGQRWTFPSLMRAWPHSGQFSGQRMGIL
jgi:hypothetical protein